MESDPDRDLGAILDLPSSILDQIALAKPRVEDGELRIENGAGSRPDVSAILHLLPLFSTE